MYGVQSEDQVEFRELLDDHPFALSEILLIDPPIIDNMNDMNVGL